jgi:DNA segregation ATPase FtsK/SpoIIIE, S-DNA-T family
MASHSPGRTYVLADRSEFGGAVRDGLRRYTAVIGGSALLALAFFILVSLVSYSSGDASLTTAANGVTANWLGTPGAWVASLLLLLLGWPSLLLAPMVARHGWSRITGRDALNPRRLWIGGLLALAVLALAAALYENAPGRDLTAGWGGIFAYLAEGGADRLLAPLNDAQARLARLAATGLLGLGGIWLWWRSLQAGTISLRWPSMPWRMRNGTAERPDQTPANDLTAEPETAYEPRRAVEAPVGPGPVIIEPTRPAASAQPRRQPMQSDMFAAKSLPDLSLLKAAPDRGPMTIDRGALDRSARLLETVLLDFQVKGVVKAVRQGPVVTMYELEPAPGTKASRVSNLADDIARNMSALSARIAPIPGRTVIGIELPNAKTEPVVLHQLIASDAFQSQNGELPIVLGKNIAGDPVIADLAPMPHLLIAGTTGSGKSVGLNAMILSLLYRLTPDQCRMIMIDPKMLELSIYDGIPHLLSPVVTEPAKAVRALKWAVEQMEDRYRMMSSLSVRNLAGYNEKIRSAKASGKSLRRRVQTGFNPETGQPVYEEEALDYEALPQIVVVVDELADLMMTAGKEVEFLIQRLAQKARAAGIHLILATQRPSVDVITGVIKANLPTRISFHVTSKIDSRTILGEMGAEQLLGKGDMLYQPGGKQPIRIHGPFVSDDEVRMVADHWRAQGVPTYIDAVTEEPEEGSFAMDGAPVGGDSAEERQYAQAVQIVVNSQRASTSSVQRALRIGYNTASRHIERMEQDGIISPPNHLGRRDVLVDRNGER